ncbi:hypothetical protein AAG906_021648 [Vitis piasezkii]
MAPPIRDKKQMDEKEGKQKITSPKRLRGPTLKPEIAKKRSEGLKIDIQYNDDDAKDRFEKPIDRWVLWKLARLKNDELTKAVEEGRSHVLAKRISSL